MRTLRVILIYLAVVIIGGALLSPWMWWALEWAVQHVSIFGDLEDTPYRRVLNRAFMVIALICMWPAVKALKLHQAHNWGYAMGWRRGLNPLVTGIIIGMAMIAGLACLELALGILTSHPRRGLDRLPEYILPGLLSGLTISLLEETFFRGILYSGIRRESSTTTAIWTTSIIYALVHFLQSYHEPETVRWYTGFVALLWSCQDLFTWDTISACLVLVQVGVILSLLREHTGHIWYAVGLHAGWVAAILPVRRVTHEDIHAPLAWMLSDYDDVNGFFAFLYLSVLSIISWRLIASAKISLRKVDDADPAESSS